MDIESQLSRRERQIMGIVYVRGEVTSQDIRGELADAPTRGALRTMLRILEDKGHLTHAKRGREFVYRSTHPKKQVGPQSLRRVIDTFFSGSLRQAVAAHLAQRDTELSEDELSRLAQLIQQARDRGK
jgi:BlaI family transcriptional regulator, penicillinase repressor